MKFRPLQFLLCGLPLALAISLFTISGDSPTIAAEPKADDYPTAIRTLLKTFCFECHSAKAKKGGLDLERFAVLDDIRKDLKPWQNLIEQIETGEMPPKDKPQPTAEEKKKLVAWVRQFLDSEATARKGDPGRVPLRRLSNAEFDATISDLTGVDLRPTREFPADGAAGEGFTNAAEALTDISPALLTKYLNAAKDLADHAVLLPEGIRFSMGKTRRDWSDEGVAKLREFYAPFAAADGKFPLQPYLLATVRHRDGLVSGRMKLDEVAAKEKLNAKYLGELWKVLNDKAASYPLDAIRIQWTKATEKDVPALQAEIQAWQNTLWQTARVGSYMRPNGSGYAESNSRQVANDPKVLDTAPVRVGIKPLPGQEEVTLYLSTREIGSADPAAEVVWQQPRFVGNGVPSLRLIDYAKYGSQFEVDYAAVFNNTAKYLDAAVIAVNDKKRSLDSIAEQQKLDPAFLKRWIEVLALDSGPKENDGKAVPFTKLELLGEKNEKIADKAWINGWKKKGTDLPIVMANSSDAEELIPGRAGAHGIMVHPMPNEFVGVAWKSPIAGSVRVNAKIDHAHPACGNGVAWWIEHRRGEKATQFAEGTVELGKGQKAPEKTRIVEKGDVLLLVVDAKDKDHVCDLTEIGFTITETEKPNRVWSLAADVADSIHAGNPHADKHGNAEAWSFVFGPTRAAGKAATNPIPPDSVLGKWRSAASDAKRQAELPKLAEDVQKLLTEKHPANDKDPNRILYDSLVSLDGPVLKGLDRSRIAPTKTGESKFGLPKPKNAKWTDDGNLVAPAISTIEVKLPAGLFLGREFAVEGKLATPNGERAVQFQATTTLPVWSSASNIVATAKGTGHAKLLRGCEEFRRVFPLFACFPQVIPTDEAVSLKMFHREDEPLKKLFLDEKQSKRLDEIWLEHLFVSKQAILESEHLPQFIGFVTQDQPKAMETYFVGQRPAFQARAEALRKDEERAEPKHREALIEFAARAYRRPLKPEEKTEIEELYRSIRKAGAAHDEAIRGVLIRIFLSPKFLFRIESAPKGAEPKPVNDWELATRLSYFLWSSMPDEELRKLAEAGKLSDPKAIATQTQRMLKDPRTRNLAIEFGTQWIHVRGFDDLKEKNEKLFPTFNAELRKAIYEESILVFQDLFQNDRAVSNLIDSDATFLNETLAKHYGIPGVNGPKWRRVEGVKKYGRGGLLGLASVQTKEAGASRTSPVLRGNWIVETLFGEKLPKPPANVPKLPEEEGGADKLTMRQQVEKHTSDASCMTCHQRIDPFGFALEKYDPIGRLRTKDFGGLPLDSKAKLKDGTEFEGLDGLKNYLLTKKKDVIVRLFCKRLLGYAVGRSVTLSDSALLDEMFSELNKNDGRISAAVLAIVRSPQFRMVRGADTMEGE